MKNEDEEWEYILLIDTLGMTNKKIRFKGKFFFFFKKVKIKKR